MSDNYQRIYQSGEQVKIAGTYVVTGTEPTVTSPLRQSHIRTFQAGDSFPADEGRDVTWWLIQRASEAAMESAAKA